MKHTLSRSIIALAVAACTDGPEAPSDSASPIAWEVGPRCIDGSGSCNVPPMVATPDGPAIELPYPTGHAGHANYVTMPTGSLAGKAGLCVTVRVDTPDGVFVRAAKPLGEVWEGRITLYFAHAGNDFTGGPVQNLRRWYASGSTAQLHAGEHRACASFADEWTAVSYGNSRENAAEFREALERAGRVGFVLGGGDGLGHGVYATGPGARIVIVRFDVE